jgi:hypothetical protein
MFNCKISKNSLSGWTLPFAMRHDKNSDRCLIDAASDPVYPCDLPPIIWSVIRAAEIPWLKQLLKAGIGTSFISS